MGINFLIRDIITLPAWFAQGISILYRYPAGEKGHYKRGRTQVLKKLEKGVDKRGRAWYSNQAVAAVSTAAERKWKKYLTATTRCGNIKKLLLIRKRIGRQNFWKKCLTNEMKLSTIAMFRRERRVPCKLNNVTKRKHQTDAWMVRNHQESEPRGSEPG